MQKEDFEELKEWLIEHDYYPGSSAVANALRELADYWEKPLKHLEISVRERFS